MLNVLLGNSRITRTAWRVYTRAVTAAAIVGAVLSQAPSAAVAAVSSSKCGPSWVAAWHASPVKYSARLEGLVGQTTVAEDASVRPLSGRTLRMMVRPAASGTAVRLHVSNRYGDQALRIGGMTVAVQEVGSAVVGATIRDVRFGGRRSASVPAGRSATSDPVTFDVRPDQTLAVSMYLIDAAGPVTRHIDTRSTSYVSDVADYAGTPGAWPFTATTTSAFYLDGVEVLTPVRMNAVMAVGDSITDGAMTSTDTLSRWPDALQRRLNAAAPGRQMTVLNAGISANRLMTDTPYLRGESATSRLPWDVAAHAGVSDVILHAGTNDIYFKSPLRTTASMISGLRRFADEAHKLGLRVFVTTITPAGYKGFATKRVLQTREAVNKWIRRTGPSVFDGVFDFAGSVTKANKPFSLAAPFDAGDKLHLGDIGQDQLASSVDIERLSGSSCLEPL